MRHLSDLPTCSYGERLPALRASFRTDEIEALLCTDLVSIRYLTGFTGSNAHLLVEPNRAVLVTDGRYTAQATQQLEAAGVEALVETTRDHLTVIASHLTGVQSLGLESESVSWAAQRQMAERFEGVSLVATKGLVAGLRQIKDEGEVARLEAAAAIADQALENVREMLVPGTTERAFGLALDSEMVRLGAEGRSFETIVASGPNGALPHARPTTKPLADGELVVVDFGAVVDGYHSDMTRTFAVGALNETQLRMVEVVGDAQARGVDAVRPGAAARDVDDACRAAIAEAGWGDAFVHGTGHGVGLQIHEAPRVSFDSDDVLSEGHCVTVEPGVYLPDQGGVRIEDSVVVTAGGCRAMTCFPKTI